MLPKITELDFEEAIEVDEEPKISASFLFNFETGQFVLGDGQLIRLTGKEALKQWINKTIRTVKARFEVYKNHENYGVGIDDLIGSNYPIDFIKKEIENDLKEALLQHEQINSLSNFAAEKDGSTLIIKFTVNSIYDDFEQEVMLYG